VHSLRRQPFETARAQPLLFFATGAAALDFSAKNQKLIGKCARFFWPRLSTEMMDNFVDKPCNSFPVGARGHATHGVCPAAQTLIDFS